MEGDGGKGMGGESWIPLELSAGLRSFIEAQQRFAGRPAEDAEMGLVAELAYCAVDEMVEGRVLIIASPWPTVDEDGGLIFPDRNDDELDNDAPVSPVGLFPLGGTPTQDRYHEIGLPVAALQDFLQERRQPAVGGIDRPLTIGDVFAIGSAALEELKARDDEQGMAWSLGGRSDFPVIDVTRSARAAAKVAFSRIAGPPPSEGRTRPDPNDRGSGSPVVHRDPPPEAHPGGGVELLPPWIPGGLGDALARSTVVYTGSQEDHIVRQFAALRYCVVDEVVGDRVLLVVTDWPVVGQDRELVFPAPPSEEAIDDGEKEGMARDAWMRAEPEAESYREIGVGRPLLQWVLDRWRDPGDVAADRPVRVGDALAMQRSALEELERQDRLGRDTLEELFLGTIYDITRAARGAAKAAFSGIVAPGIEPTVARPSPPDEEAGPDLSRPGPPEPPGQGPGDRGVAMDLPGFLRRYEQQEEEVKTVKPVSPPPVEI